MNKSSQKKIEFKQQQQQQQEQQNDATTSEPNASGAKLLA